MKSAVVRLKHRFEERLVRLAARRILSHQNARRIFALYEGAEYARQHMQSAIGFDDKNEVRLAALAAVPPDGIIAEFGVWSGRTINMIADHLGEGRTVHGFDSFEGLQEDWNQQYRKGAFHTHGRLPQVRSSVTLHKGWFEDTVPPFALSRKDEPVAFLHIDCDLYSSTKTIFDALGGRLVPGSVILFDEYFNYPEWREHEYKAFQELVQSRSLEYRYIAYNEHEWNVAVQITALG
jgi:predicted O-methyltransferase YrrM